MDEHGVGAMDTIVGVTIQEAEVRINAVEFDTRIEAIRRTLAMPTEGVWVVDVIAELDALVAAAKR